MAGRAAGPSYCIPADGVHCKGCRWNESRQTCTRPNCPALFTPRELRAQQRQWERDPHPQLIVTAGPERSGSTWLYNAARLLYQHACKPLDAYWLECVTEEALDAREAGQPGSAHVLVKTHGWSEHWDPSRATRIFVTHRDLRQVLASYRRMGWAWDLPEDYVRDHMHWKDRAHLDFAFEDIIGRPQQLLAELAEQLGHTGQVDCEAVLRDLSSLPVPTDCMDPVTQIWPNHISTPYMEVRRGAAAGQDVQVEQTATSQRATAAGGSGSRRQLDATAASRLQQRYPEYFKHYGY